MIESIRGILVKKEPLRVYLRVGEFVLKINVPLSSYDKLGKIGGPVELLCHLYLREDDIQMYGFADEQERTIFRLLITVSQISCKLGCQILSNIEPGRLMSAIAVKDTAALRAIPGIGEKLAGRIILELTDKIQKLKPDAVRGELKLDLPENVYEDSRDALVALGYNRKEAESALAAVLRGGYKPETTAELIKKCLKEISN